MSLQLCRLERTSKSTGFVMPAVVANSWRLQSPLKLLYLAGIIASYLGRSAVVSGGGTTNKKEVNPQYKFPATAYVWFKGDANSGPQRVGAGTIYDKHFILTSANYLSLSFGIRSSIEMKPEDGLYVLTGVHDETNLGPHVQNVSVIEVIIHELNNVRGTEMHDIALLRIRPSLIFNNKVSPLNLPDCNFNVTTDYEKMAISTGWGGNSEPPKPSKVLMESDVKLLTTETCQRLWGYATAVHPETGENVTFSRTFSEFHLCAGLPDGGAGACSGDEGSALYVFNQEDNTYSQIGIASLGFGCGRKEFPPVYTKVSKYLDWMVAHTQRCMPRVITTMKPKK